MARVLAPRTPDAGALRAAVLAALAETNWAVVEDQLNCSVYGHAILKPATAIPSGTPQPAREIDAFTFWDPETGEESWVGVAVVGERLMLALRQLEGDVQMSLGRLEAERLARALSTGAATQVDPRPGSPICTLQ